MVFRLGFFKPCISVANVGVIFVAGAVYSLFEYGYRLLLVRPHVDKSTNDLVVQLDSIEGVRAAVIRDKVIADREYLLITGQLADTQLSAIQRIIAHYVTNKLVVEVGKDSHFCISLPDDVGELWVIMKNVVPQMVRQHIMHDTCEYEYLMRIITAEYHTTTQFCRNLMPENCETYGVNQYPVGSFIGLTKPRNETYYPIKYANPQTSQYVSKLIQPGQSYGVVYDKGINVITFRLTKEQFGQAKAFINSHIKSAGQAFSAHKDSFIKVIQDSAALSLPVAIVGLIKLIYLYWHANDHVYSFVGVGGENCNTITQSIFEAGGLPGHYFDAMKVDEMYLRDKGIVFNIIYNQIAHFKYLHPIEFFNNILSVAYYYHSEINETRPSLLQSIHVANYSQALVMMNSLAPESLNNITDVKGYGVLHYIALINKGNVQKHSLLDAALSNGALVTRADALHYKTPASICVELNDVDCLRALYTANADAIAFVNHNWDNLIHVALLANPVAHEAAKYLYELNSQLAYQDNLEHNLPVCTLIKEGVISVDRFDEGICKTEDQVLLRYVDPVFGHTL